MDPDVPEGVSVRSSEDGEETNRFKLKLGNLNAAKRDRPNLPQPEGLRLTERRYSGTSYSGECAA